MSVKLLPSLAVCLGLGFGLGCVPGLNEHLHWNLWYIIPVSGLIFGALAGWLAFLTSYPINQKVSGVSLFILSLAALVGYAAVDYGIYFTTVVPVQGIEGLPDGDYRLSELIPFGAYLKSQLGASSISTKHGSELFQMGTAGTMISYVIDLVGALIGAAGILIYLTGQYPYCDACAKYKKREEKYNIIFDYDEKATDAVFSKIADLIEKANYKGMIAFFQELAQAHTQKKGDIKITADQRFCPDCREATILGSVYRNENRQWEELDDLSFRFTSKPGEHASVGM